jgi:NAD kinase
LNPFTVTLVRRNPHDRPDAHVALDGQIERPLRPGDAVHVRRHEKAFMLLLPPARSHFDLLRSKLKWGAR